jgi:hypothetical protein
MDFEDHQERLKQRLQSAPKRERAPRVAPLLRSMRDEIAKVAEEKNLSYRDIQQMLAADGLAVSLSTLSRHLGAKRKGREKDRKAAPIERERRACAVRSRTAFHAARDGAGERRKENSGRRSSPSSSNAEPIPFHD